MINIHSIFLFTKCLHRHYFLNCCNLLRGGECHFFLRKLKCGDLQSLKVTHSKVTHSGTVESGFEPSSSDCKYLVIVVSDVAKQLSVFRVLYLAPQTSPGSSRTCVHVRAPGERGSSVRQRLSVQTPEHLQNAREVGQ